MDQIILLNSEIKNKKFNTDIQSKRGSIYTKVFYTANIILDKKLHQFKHSTVHQSNIQKAKNDYNEIIESFTLNCFFFVEEI